MNWFAWSGWMLLLCELSNMETLFWRSRVLLCLLSAVFMRCCSSSALTSRVHGYCATGCRWGAVRAQMGRPEPWSLKYVALESAGCVRHSCRLEHDRYARVRALDVHTDLC